LTLPKLVKDVAPPSDRELVAAMARGDEAALVELHQRHRAAVRGLVLRLLSGAGDGDDCLQEVFLVAWRRARDFRSDGAVRPWLFGIAVNVVRTQRRSIARRNLLARVIGREAPEISPPPDRVVMARQTVDRLEAAVARLPAKQREAFTMVDVEGLSSVEAARALGVPAGTLGRRLHQARKRLLVALEGEFDEA